MNHLTKEQEKQYILMSDCPEIQEQAPKHLFDDGRHRITRYGENLYVRHGASFNDAGFASGGTLVWLPTQAQLQGMLKDNYLSAYKCAYAFGCYWWDILGAYEYSMEALWLAFVMKELHNKTWSGKEWV